jgi:hypothetical protein
VPKSIAGETTMKMTHKEVGVGGDVDIVAGITKLGEQVAGNTKLK